MAHAPARRPRVDVPPEPPQRRPELRLVDSADAAAFEAAPPAGRRTVQITGRPDPAPRRRSRTEARLVKNPDRVGLYGVLLGLFMMFMAVATARADTIV